MKRSRFYYLSAAILGVVIFIEIYSFLAFPEISYIPKGLPPLAMDEYRYEFFKDNKRIGNYTFWIEGSGQFKGEQAYFASSFTSVLCNNETLELETYYVFNTKLKPLDYLLNISQGGKHYAFKCLFEGNAVDVSFESENRSISKKVELPENTVLLDINMVGQWDLFFMSSDFVPGKRYSFTAFVPQLLDKVRMEIFVESGMKTIDINNVKYDCRVVRGTEQDIIYYIYNGRILRFEDLDQKVAINLLS